MTTPKIGSVLMCSAGVVTVVIEDLKIFEEHKALLQVGMYVKIEQGNRDFTIASIKSIRAQKSTADGKTDWQFFFETQPVGTLSDAGDFDRSSLLLPVPTEPVHIVDQAVLDSIFSSDAQYDFEIGPLSLNADVKVMVSGDRFFGKHTGIVGSTGSGKSCAVARIIQQAVGIQDGRNRHADSQKNAHVVIFDIHDEYAHAFGLPAAQGFTLNRLDVDRMQLPYWLMNSEELESMFIESNEANSHNQVSQFKHAVVKNKEIHNPNLPGVTYDTPVFFSIREVLTYLDNLNREVIGRLDGEDVPKLIDGRLIRDPEKKDYFQSKLAFVTNSTGKESKANNGAFHGEFNRFVSRLEATLSDKRLKFLLEATDASGKPHATADFETLLRQFVGYVDRANVTIVDLSGVPYEVLSVAVSLISRLIFDFCFHYSKLRHAVSGLNDIPMMIVCEEAHNYVPRSDLSAYRASRKSLERIAKEGRKYGLSLMVVSQRPSEVSETIFAQCSNFIALRLTNDADQRYIQALFPDNSRALTDVLPSLSSGECVVVGDAVLIPAVARIPMPNPEPQSHSVRVRSEWDAPWRDVSFSDVVDRWRR